MTAQTPEVPHWHAEFPDYPLADMPAIPLGFQDTSWRNDSAPSFWHPALRLQLFADYKDVSLREFEEGERFCLNETDDEQGCGPEILCTDDWNKVLQAVIGERFAASLLEDLGEGRMRTIRYRNAAESPASGVCHSHDFCDANMVMLDAFVTIMGREPRFLEGTDNDGNWTPEQEADLDLFNRAWSWAKARHLTEKGAN